MFYIKNKWLRPQSYHHFILGIAKRNKVRKECSFGAGKIGLEIGGPSHAFSNSGIMPLYKHAKRIDGINYTNKTIWSDNNKEEYYDKVGNVLGKQYILDGTNLEIGKLFQREVYDFILSSNNLEHIANPLKAIEQWISVLRIEGILIIIVPNKNCMFDHKRSIVDFSHLKSDYDNNIDENDMTHYEEIIREHDLKMDPRAGTKDEFIERSNKNYENRCFHQHVFDFQVLEEIGKFFNLGIINEVDLTYENLIIYKKMKV